MHICDEEEMGGGGCSQFLWVGKVFLGYGKAAKCVQKCSVPNVPCAAPMLSSFLGGRKRVELPLRRGEPA